MHQRRSATRYAIGFLVGCFIFVAVPEFARSLHGGAFAQQTVNDLLGNTAIGNAVLGHQDYSVTTGPPGAAPVIGGENNLIACPDQNAVGTYVGPGGSMSVTVNGNGGGGTGFRQNLTVGGSGCK